MSPTEKRVAMHYITGLPSALHCKMRAHMRLSFYKMIKLCVWNARYFVEIGGEMKEVQTGHVPLLPAPLLLHIVEWSCITCAGCVINSPIICLLGAGYFI